MSCHIITDQRKFFFVSEFPVDKAKYIKEIPRISDSNQKCAKMIRTALQKRLQKKYYAVGKNICLGSCVKIFYCRGS